MSAVAGTFAGLAWHFSLHRDSGYWLPDAVLGTGFGLAPALSAVVSPKPWVSFLLAPMLGFAVTTAHGAFLFKDAAGVWPDGGSILATFLGPKRNSCFLVLTPVQLPLAFHWLRMRGTSWRLSTGLLRVGTVMATGLTVSLSGYDATRTLALLTAFGLLAAGQHAALEIALWRNSAPAS